MNLSEEVLNVTSFEQGEMALKAAEVMEHQGIHISRNTAYIIVEDCVKKKDLIGGRRVQSLIIRNGLNAFSVLGDHIIRLFASCRNLYEANVAFDKVFTPSVHTWSAIISSHVKLGQYEKALDLYHKLPPSQAKFDRYVCIAILIACAMKEVLTESRLLHSQIIKSGLESDAVIERSLVCAYDRCGSLQEAREAFERSQNGDSVLWGSMISAYSQHRQLDHAIELFETMDLKGIKPDTLTFSSLLKICGNSGAIGQGRMLHDQIIGSEFESDAVLGNTLLDMYGKCGMLGEADRVFSKLHNRNLVSWSIMIEAYARQGHGTAALEFFEKMLDEGIDPDKVIFLSTLKACGCLGAGALKQGRALHEQIVDQGLGEDVVLGNNLVDMYSKCGSLEEAYISFNKLQNQTVVSFGAMIVGYIQHGNGSCALELFKCMEDKGIQPNKIIYSSILKACSCLGALEEGKVIHEKIIQEDLEHELILGNTLIDMYAKCGQLNEALKVFDELQKRDAISWSAMIMGYAQHGLGIASLELFQRMEEEGQKPEKVAVLSALKACGLTQNVQQGRIIHEHIITTRSGLDALLGSALIDMYAKCANLQEAQQLFDSLQGRDLVTWGTMIAGYVCHGHGVSALELFEKMQYEGIQPNEVIFLSALKACGSIGALEQGRLIENKIIRSGLEGNALGGALIDMYARCGNMKEACKVFDALPKQDAVSWGAIIAGYARSGDAKLAGECLDNMQKKNIKPDNITFTSILAACSHAGLLEAGSQYFISMMEDHGIPASPRHFACMVDLLSRAGRLNEADSFLKTCETSLVGWTSLLSACRTYGNVEIGKRCFDHVAQVDPHDASAYVLMSNIFSHANMEKEAVRVEELRMSAGAQKKPARAWIEIGNKVHEFIVGARNHPRIEEVYATLKRLNKEMKEQGYAPQTNLVLREMTNEEKEDALCGHCEKLAIAFGLISTPGGTTIRATKNLRTCKDCHSMTKIISKVEQREIIIKDAYRIHRFKDGACSCGDFD